MCVLLKHKIFLCVWEGINAITDNTRTAYVLQTSSL